MKKEAVLAYVFTFLIFVGGAFYLFASPNWEGISNFSISNVLNNAKDSKSSSLEHKKRSVKKSKKKKTKRKKPSIVDNYNGVNVYYNGNVTNVNGRSITEDGYNLGLKYQCVEFVKRYYYEHLNHKMPDSYGHAKEFFDASLTNGDFNKARGLYQFKNKSFDRPKPNDILIFDGNKFNKFGHVVIVSKSTSDYIEIIQQNPGPKNSSRAKIPIVNKDGIWELRGADILGWLSKES